METAKSARFAWWVKLYVALPAISGGIVAGLLKDVYLRCLFANVLFRKLTLQCPALVFQFDQAAVSSKKSAAAGAGGLTKFRAGLAHLTVC